MTTDLIEGHLSIKHTNAAIEAVLKYSEKKQKAEEETSMLGAQEERISLQITKKRIRQTKEIDPKVIPLAHPVIDPRKTQICLITKDPQREYKDLLEEKGIKHIGRVVGIAKLKGKWKGFEERRQLLNENGLFLVDDRVAAMMPHLLGKMWFKAKKQPLPVKMDTADLKTHLQRAINNTFMNENSGQTVTVKVATTSHSAKHIYENISTALPKIISNIDGGWDNIQNVYLTLPGLSLPLWTCDLGSGKGGRWENMSKPEAEEWTGFGGADEEDEEGCDAEEDSDVPVAKDKGKKRSLAPVEDEEDIPKKKSKATKPSPSSNKFTKAKPLPKLASGNSETESVKPKVGVKTKPATRTTEGMDQPHPKVEKKQTPLIASLESKKKKVMNQTKSAVPKPKERIVGKASSR